MEPEDAGGALCTREGLDYGPRWPGMSCGSNVGPWWGVEPLQLNVITARDNPIPRVLAGQRAQYIGIEAQLQSASAPGAPRARPQSGGLVRRSFEMVARSKPCYKSSWTTLP